MSTQPKLLDRVRARIIGMQGGAASRGRSPLYHERASLGWTPYASGLVRAVRSCCAQPHRGDAPSRLVSGRQRFRSRTVDPRR